MPLIRTEHWATREFSEYLLTHKDDAFEWGSQDCSLFAANAIHSFTGVDMGEDFRGKYTDEDSAFALIKTLTGGSTVADAAEYCAQKYGLVEWIKPLYAQRGDLVVIQNGDRLIAGVVHLNGANVIAMSESGIMRLPLRTVQRAWRV